MGVTKRKRPLKGGKVKIFHHAEVYVSGNRVAAQCFDTAGAAQDWHDKIKRQYEKGSGRWQAMTLNEIIAQYRKDEFPSKQGPTRRRLEGCFGLLEESPAGTVRMRDFDGGTINELLDWLIEHPRAATPTRNSFTRELKALSVVLTFFRDSYDAQFVPPITKRHRKRSLFKGPLPKKGKDFFLPVEHARAWLSALKAKKNPVFFGLAVCQVILGLRVGEACALCEDVIDFERGRIVIKRTMEWATENGKCRLIAERTKTAESRRELPLPPEVAEVLRVALGREPAVYHKREDGKPTRVAFHMPSGELLHDQTVRNAYTDAFQKVGLPWTGSHICRDTTGTLALSGASLEAVRVNHGHTSVVETEGYAKVHAMIQNTVPETVARLIYPDNTKKNSRTDSRTAPEEALNA